MNMGLVGRKCGMSQLFNEETGDAVPVTLIEILPNIVTAIKTPDRDGYVAVQVTTGKANKRRLSKAEAGHFAKANVEAGRGLWEFRVDAKTAEQLKVGDTVPLETFSVGQIVDVTATSKGKGFAGTVKRHNFATQDATHGNSLSHRAPGSIGMREKPGRVFKGKRMSGHMGNERCTVQKQPVMYIDTEKNILLVRGGVPGAVDGTVIVRPTVKIKRPKAK